MDDCWGFVLAGGESARMGQDKALLPFGERPLAAWMAERVRRVCGTVTLVGDAAKYSVLGFPVVEDVYAGHGPLGGIHAALVSSRARFNLIVACDMPYLSTEFLAWMLQVAKAGQRDATIPESESHGYEPLCALYTPGCLRPIEEVLRSGERKISRALEGLAVRAVPTQEWKRYDAEGKLFRNLNTPEEYERARAELLAGERRVGQTFQKAGPSSRSLPGAEPKGSSG
jgi:molybdopterin-guanine dinucleotide biosynthesis protein A